MKMTKRDIHYLRIFTNSAEAEILVAFDLIQQWGFNPIRWRTGINRWHTANGNGLLTADDFLEVVLKLPKENRVIFSMIMDLWECRSWKSGTTYENSIFNPTGKGRQRRQSRFYKRRKQLERLTKDNISLGMYLIGL